MNYSKTHYSLYKKEWCPFIKETFNGFGNAIEYLGRYTHKVAIANSRILSVDEQWVTFSARGRNPGEPRRTVTLDFVRSHYRVLLQWSRIIWRRRSKKSARPNATVTVVALYEENQVLPLPEMYGKNLTFKTGV